MNSEIEEKIDKIEKGIVPKGYKKTKVGIIPGNWKVEKLESIAKLSAGATPSTKNEKYWNGNIPWMSSGEINDKEVYYTDKFITELGFENSSTSFIPEESVLMAIAGQGKTRGKVAVNHIELTTNQSLIAIINSYGNFNYKYVYYFLDKNYLKLRHISTGAGGRRSLNMGLVSKFKLPFPSLEEQEKIADILSLWDKSIETTEKLIKEKEIQKKGLMQELLKGETRLPGFNGEWVEVKLGEIFSERNEKKYEDYELLAITTGKGIIKRDELDVKDNSSSDKSNYKRILPGDIGYNTMRMWQGVSGLSKYKGIVSPAYTILEPKDNIDSLYFSYLFKIDSIIYKFLRYSQGLVKDTLNLKYSNFKKISINYPKDLREQKAISEILSTSDKEIELLKQLLSNKKQEKKGVMQLLLTGIVRV